MASPVDPDDPSRPLSNLHRTPINPGQYRNKCRFCPSTFQKSEHLSRHERSHTKQRPYVCDIPGCGKAFTRGDSLTRHLRLHESGGVKVEDDEPRRKRRKGGEGKSEEGKSPESSGRLEGPRSVS
jgi:hypothetical protein